VALPAYAVRATSLYKLVLSDFDQTNGSMIVYSGAGPRAVPIHFQANGIVILEFDKSPYYSGGVVDPYEVSESGHVPTLTNRAKEVRDSIRERRYQYMNAFLTCFNVTINRGHEIFFPSSSVHYIWARYEIDRWHFEDNGTGGLSKYIGILDPIPSKNLIETLIYFNKIKLNQIDEALEMLDLFYRVAYHMNNREFQTVIILGWAIIEASQNIIWANFVKGGYKFINPHSDIKGKRLKSLMEDRNFTASVKSQVLALVGVYTDHEIEQVDKVRRTRNAFMHGLAPTTEDDGYQTIWACRWVVEKAFGLQLQPFGSSTSWDYIR
jgi:hypothetical protein